jgi:hypothetical protein
MDFSRTAHHVRQSFYQQKINCVSASESRLSTAFV